MGLLIGRRRLYSLLGWTLDFDQLLVPTRKAYMWCCPILCSNLIVGSVD